MDDLLASLSGNDILVAHSSSSAGTANLQGHAAARPATGDTVEARVDSFIDEEGVSLVGTDNDPAAATAFGSGTTPIAEMQMALDQMPREHVANQIPVLDCSSCMGSSKD